MVKNTFFANEPWFLKVIYGFALASYIYMIASVLFGKEDFSLVLRLLCPTVIVFLIYRKFLSQKT